MNVHELEINDGGSCLHADENNIDYMIHTTFLDKLRTNSAKFGDALDSIEEENDGNTLWEPTESLLPSVRNKSISISNNSV